MQIITRWRSILSINNHIIPSVSHFSAFHSTPCSCHRFPNQKRADAKKARAGAKQALKYLFFNSRSLRFSFEDKETKRKLDGNSGDRSNSYSNKGQPKPGCQFGGKPQNKINQQVSHAIFGHYTWIKWREHTNRTDTNKWREHTNRTNTKKWRKHKDDASRRVGPRSDRTILGLPPTGPLKIEDVKIAFRSSALKWHPDKHPGPSQAIAEEKFKLCLNAYETLCNALSAA